MLWGLRTAGRTRRGAAAVVAVLLVTTVLAGCSTPQQPAPSRTVTPVPSATPVFASNEEALAAAQAVYDRYVKIDDQITNAGGKNDSRYAQVLAKDALQDAQSSTAYEREHKLHTSGSTTSAKLRFQQADLASGSLTAYVCSDISKSRTLNAQNKDVTPKDREPRATLVVTFERIDNAMMMVKSVVGSGPSVC